MNAPLARLVLLAVTLLLTGCPSSRVYHPGDANEQQIFSAARRDIFPEDVRTDVSRYRTQILLWSGIIREVRPVETVQGPGMEVLFEHHYWDFIEDYSIQKARAFLSPRGEGRFQAAFPKQHAPPPEHVRVDDMAIVYGTPERLESDSKETPPRHDGEGHFNHRLWACELAGQYGELDILPALSRDVRYELSGPVAELKADRRR